MRRAIYFSIVLAVLLSLVLVMPGGAAPASADRGPWAVGVAYAVNDTVTHGGSTYRCIQAHTSQADWSPPVVPALWGLVTGGGATATRTNTPGTGPTATRTRTPTPGTGPTATRTRTPTPAPTGGAGCWAAWVSTTAYNGGAQVSRSGRNYQAAYWTQNNDPVTNSGPAGTGPAMDSHGVLRRKQCHVDPRRHRICVHRFQRTV